MSRIGKKSIPIPPGVQVTLQGNRIAVEGPKGKLEKEVPAVLVLTQEGSELFLAPHQGSELSKPVNALWGTFRQIVANMLEGVTKGFEKKLEIEGVGYRASVSANTFEAEVGYTLPSKVEIPSGLQVAVEKNVIAIGGPDKELVGQFAAKVRSLRKVEPYKGKGIRYEKEIVKRKLGKRAAAAGAPGATS